MAEQTEINPPEPAAIPAILAQGIETQDDQELHYIATQVGSLSNSQIQVLGAFCKNIASGNIQTDTEIGAELGLDQSTIWRYRKNPAFAAALSMLMRHIAQGTADKALGNLMKLSEKDTKATEIWLRIAKVFDPVQKTFNVNAQLPMQDQAKTLEAVIDEFLMNLGASGYPIEKIVSRYHELRSEGAF